MAISSHGYTPLPDGAAGQTLSIDNIELLWKNEAAVLGCADYFFCQHPAAFCSWAYFSGDGPLFAGYLLLGWRDGCLTQQCASCGGNILITYFGGMLTRNSWSGLCRQCHHGQRGDTDMRQFHDRMSFVQNLRKMFPYELREWQEYDGHVFTWGGNGLKPTRRKRIVVRQLAEPVSFELLIEELASGTFRTENPPNVRLLQNEVTLKFGIRDGAAVEIQAMMNLCEGSRCSRVRDARQCRPTDC